MRQRIASESAYILARRPYRESSLLLEAFSEQHGRIGLVARAARGGRSKNTPALQTFVPLLLSWTEAADLGTLTAAEAAGPAVPLQGERIFHGWYVNELLLKLLPRHDPHPSLFALYAATLPQLAAADPEPALRNFELHLLGELGYGLELADDLEAQGLYRYDPDLGLQRAAPGQRDACSGAALIALRDAVLADAPPPLRREVRLLLRAALQRQLGERELETPRLLRELRAKLAPPAAPARQQSST
jgi:DNA repair protein RecO (recombination protein O)